MKGETIRRHRTNLRYDTGASIRRLVSLTASKTGEDVIDFNEYTAQGVLSPDDGMGFWCMDDDGRATWTWVTGVRKVGNTGYIVLECESSERESPMDYLEAHRPMDYLTTDELVNLLDIIERIYHSL